RRIKRSFNVDLNTIRFLTDEETQHFAKFELLHSYMASKRQEIEEHNKKHASNPDTVPNVRRLTNVGTFRAYIAAYLKQNPKVHKSITNIVRQLHPTPVGLPIEVYVFSNDIAWANYEGIHADIFDHLLAIAKEFGLRVFQRTSGQDL